MLDIRWPIGLMFTVIGAIMIIFGLITGQDAEMYKRSLDMNINLVWGILLLAFGVFMLVSAKIAAAAEKKDDKPKK
jgi:putative Mn2+ efflux pump MntP